MKETKRYHGGNKVIGRKKKKENRSASKLKIGMRAKAYQEKREKKRYITRKEINKINGHTIKEGKEQRWSTIRGEYNELDVKGERECTSREVKNKGECSSKGKHWRRKRGGEQEVKVTLKKKKGEGKL